MTIAISPQPTPWIYNPQQKVKEDGTRAALVGGGLCGVSSLGFQAYAMKNPTGIFCKYLDKGKIAHNKYNWKTIGIAALIGATIFGLSKALHTAYKNLPEKTSSNKSLDYKA